MDKLPINIDIGLEVNIAYGNFVNAHNQLIRKLDAKMTGDKHDNEGLRRIVRLL
jgi:hypothetical protein